MTSQQTEVLIVGAGPTGLAAACELARYQIPFIIIDQKEGPSFQSKALGVQARTLELLERWGVADEAASEGYPAQGALFLLNGKPRFSVPLAAVGKGLTRYPYLLILEQDKTERILIGKLRELGKEVFWQNTLRDLVMDDQRVVATVEKADGERIEIAARYLIAADGARSPIRHIVGIPFRGGTYENQFFLLDTEMDWDVPKEYIAVQPVARGITAFFPMKGGQRYRALGVVPPEWGNKEELSFEEAELALNRLSKIPIKIRNPWWVSIYRLHHRCIDQFRKGRCFFAGDAAHVHSPAGGQGMNTGIQDAINIGWKLAFVLKGWMKEGILDTYHRERHPFAMRLVKTTDTAFTIGTAQTFWARMLRIHIVPRVVPVLLGIESLRKWVFRAISQIGIRYGETPFYLESGRVPFLKGERMPDATLTDGIRVYEALKSGKLLLLICGENGLARFSRELQPLLQGNRSQYIEAHTLSPGQLPSSQFQSNHNQEGLLLIRPDGYVAFQSFPPRWGMLGRFLERWFEQAV